jgi:cation transport regulator ChaB
MANNDVTTESKRGQWVNSVEGDNSLSTSYSSKDEAVAARRGAPHPRRRVDGRHHRPRAGLRQEKSMAGKDEVPSTLTRSEQHAQEIFIAAHDSAVDSYGEGERAHRTAFAAVKHEYEKVGDHWEPKDEKGPSDAKAEGGVDTPAQTRGGVDANASKEHLLGIAKKLDITGRSSMNKDELVDAIQKANARETRKARE